MADYDEQAVFLGFNAMCSTTRRLQKMMEKKESEPVESTLENIEDGMKRELFQIDVENEARGILVHIQAEDSGDAVFMAGFVISGFRKLGIDCKSKAII